MRRLLTLGLCAAALAGCPDKTPPEATDGGTSAKPPEADAAPDATPKDLTLEIRYEDLDGGWHPLPVTPDGARPVIDPTARLEVRTNLGLNNYRVRLFDEVDRALESDDEADDLNEAIVYRIQLPAPLKTGHKYALSVDAQTGSAITDAAGRIHPDQRVEFQVAGEKEKPPPPAPKKKPAKKRRR